MAIEWKYRGRIFNLADIESIRRLIAANPEASRWALSRKLCEAWNWKQANGALRDMVCRGLLLMLERAGEIELPPVRRHPPGKPARPQPVIPDDRNRRAQLTAHFTRLLTQDTSLAKLRGARQNTEAERL